MLINIAERLADLHYRYANQLWFLIDLGLDSSHIQTRYQVGITFYFIVRMRNAIKKTIRNHSEGLN